MDFSNRITRPFSVITRSNTLAGCDEVSFSPITAKGGDCHGNKLPRNDGEKDRKKDNISFRNNSNDGMGVITTPLNGKAVESNK